MKNKLSKGLVALSLLAVLFGVNTFKVTDQTSVNYVKVDEGNFH
ncbi:hypothetical protein [Macrococcus equipercicus]|nr:hypothetical protein [Macrococcus equipercicus]